MTGDHRAGPCGPGRFARWLVMGVAAGLVVCAFPAVAGATDYCVDTIAACGPKNVASFQDALDKSAATGNADRIFLGATTYTAPIASGFTYDQQAGPVEIIGAGGGGPTPTIVTSPPGGSDRVLRLMGGPGTSIHDVEIELPQNVVVGLRGLWTNGTARRIRVVGSASGENDRPFFPRSDRRKASTGFAARPRPRKPFEDEDDSSGTGGASSGPAAISRTSKVVRSRGSSRAATSPTRSTSPPNP